MVRRADPDVTISRVGDIFAMRVHNDGMGDYQITNQAAGISSPAAGIGW